MKMSRIQRRLATWIACLAVLIPVFAPALSQALAARAPSGLAYLAEICSAEHPGASMLVQVDGAPDPGSGASHLAACPYCLPHANPLALLPAVPALDFAGNASFPPPPLFLHARRPLFAWAAPQARAPPSLS